MAMYIFPSEAPRTIADGNNPSVTFATTCVPEISERPELSKLATYTSLLVGLKAIAKGSTPTVIFAEIAVPETTETLPEARFAT